MLSRDILTRPCMCQAPKRLDPTFPTMHLYRIGDIIRAFTTNSLVDAFFYINVCEVSGDRKSVV